MRHYKIIMMGSSGVGKSALTIRYVQNTFTNKYDPTIEDVYKKWTQVEGHHCLLEIIDTAGTKQFDSMRDLYIKDGDGFALVFAVNCRKSLSEVSALRSQIMRLKKSDDVPIVIVANKTDLNDERVISRHQAVVTALDGNHCQIVECSAKTGLNIDEVFDDIVRQIIERESRVREREEEIGECRCVLL